MLGAYPATAAAPTPGGPRAPQGGEVGLELVADGLTSPVVLTEPPDGSGRLFLVDQTGQIRIVSREGELLEEPFLDLKDRLVQLNPDYDERGLLGLAFHPDFTNNRRFFVYYSAPRRSAAPPDWDHTGRLSEFQARPDNPSSADPASERVVLEVDDPQANANGGHIAFGPDGLLYVPLGDGGNANDAGVGHSPQGNAQDVTNLLGDVLRIDVNAPPPYGFPADNPFNGRPDGRPEIFASGFHNPTHLSFDQRGNRQLFVSDGGQDRYEEVNIVNPGNYGWRIKEGTHCFNTTTPTEPLDQCPSRGPFGEFLVDPVIEYPRRDFGGTGVVGGYIYRGRELPELAGRYVFGDYSRDRMRPDGMLFVGSRIQSGLWPLQEIRPFLDSQEISGSLDHFLLGFGQDSAGEIYLLARKETGPDGETGKVFRLGTRQIAPPPPPQEQQREMSPVVWVVAGAISLIALFLILRLGRAPKTSK